MMYTFYQTREKLVLIFSILNFLQYAEYNRALLDNDGVSEADANTITDVTVPTYIQDNATGVFSLIDNITGTDNYTNEAENVTEIVNEISTLSNETETTTPVLENIVQESISMSHWQSDVCTCDLLSGSCDVNCCCDKDCTEWDIQAFPQCFNEEIEVNSEYCFSSDIIYKNNTQYKKIKLESSGLFCIVHDNFKERFTFKELPAFHSMEEFDKLYRSSVFSWDMHENEDDKLKPSVIMKAGDPLFIASGTSFSEMKSQWRIPSQCFTTMCDCTKEVVYMEDLKTSCSRRIHDITRDCEKIASFSAAAFGDFCVLNYHKNGTITSSALQEIQEEITDAENVTDSDARTSVFNCISSNDRLKPEYDPSEKMCRNVVTHVSYTIMHNGIHGITDIIAGFSFTNITKNMTSFHQHFSIDFVWNSANNTMKRSGNPGYHVGYPVLTGQRVVRDITSHALSPVIERNYPGLTILKSDENGYCDSMKRNDVYFGKNLKSGCFISVSEDTCAGLQDRIMLLLKGSIDETTYTGSFGNANSSNLGDWLEIFHENSVELSQTDLVCHGLTTGVKIDIAYAAVGSLLNPQNKIVGVVFRYIGSQTIQLKCADIYCPIVHISTSVTFIDVSEMAVPVYSRLPVLKAKLPYDFFYPFLPSTGNKNVCSWINMFISFCIAFHCVCS